MSIWLLALVLSGIGSCIFAALAYLVDRFQDDADFTMICAIISFLLLMGACVSVGQLAG